MFRPVHRSRRQLRTDRLPGLRPVPPGADREPDAGEVDAVAVHMHCRIPGPLQPAGDLLAA